MRYEAPEFPRHLLGEKHSIIDKTVTVYYNDGTYDILKFVGFLTP